MNDFPWLTCIIFTPWVGALLLACLPRAGAAAVRTIALVFSLSTLAWGAGVLTVFRPTAPGFQLVERHAWIAAFNVDYHLGLDSLSLLLVLLTGIVTPLVVLASWRQERDRRLFHGLVLLLQGAALGVFLTLNFFPWFIFWELSLVPAYFLIKLWGGPGATRAAYQFVIYTMGGSIFLLAGFAAIYAVTGTLDFARLAADGALAGHLGGGWGMVVFLGLLLGFAVKVPLFPFHTWLPSAYAEAPTGVAMFLTAVMSKMGVYGFFRILWPLFPERLHAASGVLLWLALGGVVLGSLAALAQKDLKRMVAYSSVNHVNYCLLALFAVMAAAARLGHDSGAVPSALDGALLQMLNHGVTAAAMFFCIGVLEMRAGGRRGLGDFGGVRAAAPVFAGLCGITMFSSLGLPGLNGFVSEFLIFRGVFALAPWMAAAGCLGLLITGVFLLTFYLRVFHGPTRGAAAGFRDLSAREIVTLAPAIVLMFAIGLAPEFVIRLFNPLVTTWAARLLHP